MQAVWFELKNNLHHINSVHIPRHVLIKNAISIELHGFSDASEKTYGACIYFKPADSFNNIMINLLISKSKVAPLRAVTLLRLELCGALLLANLTKAVVSSMPQLVINKKYFYSDSKIVLSWIASTPNRWKTFVANWVASIQEVTKSNEWYYVKSENNPADICSRGMTPLNLANCICVICGGADHPFCLKIKLQQITVKLNWILHTYRKFGNKITVV